MEMSRDVNQKRKESLFMELLRAMTKKHAYISNKMELQNHSLTFFH